MYVFPLIKVNKDCLKIHMELRVTDALETCRRKEWVSFVRYVSLDSLSSKPVRSRSRIPAGLNNASRDKLNDENFDYFIWNDGI